MSGLVVKCLDILHTNLITINIQKKKSEKAHKEFICVNSVTLVYNAKGEIAKDFFF